MIKLLLLREFKGVSNTNLKIRDKGGKMKKKVRFLVMPVLLVICLTMLAGKSYARTYYFTAKVRVLDIYTNPVPNMPVTLRVCLFGPIPYMGNTGMATGTTNSQGEINITAPVTVHSGLDPLPISNLYYIMSTQITPSAIGYENVEPPNGTINRNGDGKDGITNYSYYFDFWVQENH